MSLTVDERVWDDWNEEHIARHQVTVEEVCFADPWVLRTSGRDKLALYGQTDGGRYLLVILARRGHGIYYPVTARSMSDTERRRYRERRG